MLRWLVLWLASRVRLVLERPMFRRTSPKGWEELDDVDNWVNALALDEVSFDHCINELPYRIHANKRFLDYSFPFDKPEYFFKDLPYGRACEDWARIWSIYWIGQGKVAEEWIVSSRKGLFKYAHFVSILHDDNGFRLADYYLSGYLPSVEECIKLVSRHWDTDAYDDGKIIAVRYRTWKPCP